ncbi:MAG: hypothetical protein R3C10_26990 [Pirellulales bacterium]
MWCSECRQEVPAIAATSSGALACARCGRKCESWPGGETSSLLEEIPGDAWTELTGWQSSDDLGQIGRMLEEDAQRSSQRSRPQTVASAKRRHDVGGDDDSASIGWQAGWVAEEHRATSLTVAPPKRRPAARSIGPIILLSMMTVACGGSLLVWSVIRGRADLWDLGFPIALAGQIGLAVGVVLQLERIWLENRHLDGKLDAVNTQVKQLTRRGRVDAATTDDQRVPPPHFAEQTAPSPQRSASYGSRRER